MTGSLRTWICRHRAALALAAVVAAGAALRFWGIGFGLPQLLVRPDEGHAVDMISRHYVLFRPTCYNYPSLYPYLFLLWSALAYPVGLMAGAWSSLVSFLAAYEVDPWPFHLVARTLTAALGTLTIVLVYHIGRLASDRTVGLASALLTALAYLHVRDSHFGVTDVPMTFFIAWSVLYMMEGQKSGRLRHDVGAALCAGLAASTKYSGAMLAAPFVVMCMMRASGQQDRHRHRHALGRVLLFCVVAGAAFVFGTPYSLVDRELFIGGILYEMRHLAAGHGVLLGQGWWYHAWFTLPGGLGWPLFAAGLAGMALWLTRDWKIALPLLLFPIVYYTTAGKGYTVFVRYMVPVVPFLCLSAGYGVITCWRWAARHSPRADQWWIPVLGLCLLSALGALRAISFDHLLTKVDTRVDAARWLIDNAPEGATVGITAPVVATLTLPKPRAELEAAYDHAASMGRPARIKKASLERWDRFGRKGFYVARYDWDKRSFGPAGPDTGRTPHYIVVERSPLTAYSRTPAEIDSLLRTDYRLVASFGAIDSTMPGSRYDQQDAFYLPYVGFGGVDRPGPNVLIYTRLRG